MRVRAPRYPAFEVHMARRGAQDNDPGERWLRSRIQMFFGGHGETWNFFGLFLFRESQHFLSQLVGKEAT